ncbi:MAG: UbiA family prenyltransferase [Chloroflexota bacterium]|nr:UbiA family prenyltransferase [Chloroflexota bacterium]
MTGQTVILARKRSHLSPSVMRLCRMARIIHPFPTLLNVAATAALAFVAEKGRPDAGVVVRMLALMFCAQSAIGVVNDYFDRDLDAATKPWKPLAAGLVSPAVALVLAALLIAVTSGIGVSLGPASLALALLGLASGLIYDARLKRMPLSPLPFMVGITTLPLWVWVTLGEWDAALWWLLPLGSLIGFALHLANTVPDIDGDAANGVRGLAHRLGARRSMHAGWASFGGALALSALLIALLDYDLRVYLPAIAAGSACLAASIFLYLRRRDAWSLQFGFGALGIGAAILAAGWLAAVG